MASAKELYCIGCGRFISKSEFWKNHNSLCFEHDGMMMFCKNCCKTISDKIFAEHSNYQCAVIQMCNTFWMPFNIDACNKLQSFETDTLITGDRKINRVYQYGVCLRESNVSESEWNNLIGNSNMKLKLLKIAKGNNAGDEELFDDLERIWGSGYDSLEDYLFLEEKFQEYTNDEELSIPMLNVVRYLCQAELLVIKLKNKNADQKEIDAAEKRVTAYYKTLKLDDFKFDKSKTDAEKLIENWAYIEENIEPLDWVDEHLEDICKFKEDNDSIMRSLGNKVCNTKDYPTLDAEDVKRKRKK